MNHIYKVIWNTITQTWVAVSELSRAKGKTKSSKTLSAVVLAAVSAGAIIGDAEAAIFAGQGDGISIQSQERDEKVAKAEGVTAIAIGYDVSSKGTSALAIGTQTHATGEKTVAIGHLSTATGSESAAFGVNATAKGNGDIALGKHAVAEGGKDGKTGSAALGDEAHATGAQSAAVGGKSSASGTHTIASGYKANASGENAAAFGADSTASGTNSASIGPSSTASGSNSAALGMQAEAKGAGALAAGAAAQATQNGSTAVGAWTKATAEKTTALGDSAHATTNRATALGHDSQATGEFSTATGVSSRASGSASVATGKNAKASGASTIAIGDTANATGTDSIATGREAATTGSSAIATGAESSAANNASAYGNKAKATGGWSSAFGNESKAGAADASAFGNTATAAAQDSTAIGAHSSVTSVATGGTALGRSSSVTTAGGVALGQGSTSTRAALDGKNITISSQGNVVSSNHITDDDSRNNNSNDVYAPVKLINDPKTLTRVKETIKGTAGAVSLGNATTTRQLTNLAPGSADSDAVNVAQLKAVVGTIKHYNVTSKDGDITINPDTTDPNKTVWDLKINPKYKIKYFSVKSEGGANENNDGATATDAIAIGKNASSTGSNAVSLGSGAKALGNNNTAIGAGAQAKDVRTTAVGYNATAEAASAVGIGYEAHATKSRSLAIGQDATASANNAIALGSSGQQSGNDRPNKTTASAEHAVAIGSGAVANLVNGIALGSQSKTTADKGQTGFDASQDVEGTRTNKYNNLKNNVQNVRTSTLAGLSIGDTGKTRQINHLAAGTADDDAVNVAQLKSVNLAFKGNSGSGDVRLHDQRLSVVGATDSFITTKASDNKLEISTTQGTFSTTDGKSSASKKGLATTTDVADTINKTYWQLQANGNKVGDVNPGDKVNIASGNGITVTPTTEANGISKITINATVAGIKAGNNVTVNTKDGISTINAIDTNTQASVSKAANSPITINATGADNAKNYELDVAVDNTTISKAGGTLHAVTGAIEEVTTTTTGNNAKKKGQVKAKSGDENNVTTAENVANMINSAKWFAKAGNDKDAEVSEDDTKADETANKSATMKAGETLGLKAGKNLRVKRDGTNFTFALNNTVDLTDKGSLTIGNTKVDNGGITITPAGKSPVSLTANGLDNGNNKIVNVANGTNPTDAVNKSQLDDSISTESVVKADAEAGDTNIATITVADSKNTGDKGAKYLVNVSKNTVKEAAREAIDVKGKDFISVSNETKNGTETHTVGATTNAVTMNTAEGKANTPTATGLTTNKDVADAINASGWKISGKDTAASLVNPGNEVSFEGGEGTTVTVSGATNGKRTVTIASTVKPNAKGVIEEVTENGTGENAPKKGQVKAKSGDENNVTTAENVANMINSAKWFAKAGNDKDAEVSEDDTKADETANKSATMKAGETLGLKAGKNLRVKRDGTNFTFALNNTVDLTDKGSLTIGNTKVDNGGITITPAGKSPVSLTANGLDNGNNKIVNVAKGTEDNDAVNVKQLKETELHIAPTKANSKDSGLTYTYDDKTKSVTLKYKDGNGNDIENTEAKIDLSGLASKIKDYSFKTNATGSNLVEIGTETTVASGKSVNFAASDNLTLKQDVKDGNVTYTYGLKNQVVVGEKGTPGADGKPGKEGVDGSIGVNGKDGSAVAINGKDGSIGLNGENGRNGLTIKGQDGKVGVDGKDGETRLVYVEKADPTKPGSTDKTHELATLEDGMKYGGDIGEVANVKLNKQVDIKGGVTDITKLSDNNIGVVSTPNATTGGTELTVKLAKELKGLTSAEFNDGKDKTKTEITHNGIAITPVNPENGKTSVTLTDKGLNNGGNTITNVAEGKNGTDAVNVNQLNKVEAKINEGGLTFAGNSGTPHKANLNTTVNIKGGKDNTDATQFDDGKNVMTTVNKNTVTVAIKKTPEVEGINIIDKDGKVKVKLTQTNEGLKVSDGNDKETRITNVAEGKNGTDAVNVKQLNAAKTEVTAGDNIDVVSRTGANGQTIYKVSAKGINDTSAAVKAGSNHVEVTKAANTHKDGSTTITDYTVDLSKETKEDIKKGVDAHTEVTTKGLTFNADHGTTGVKKLGSKVAVNGDGKNITTTADENGVKVSMKDDIKVNSVTAKEVKVGDVNINENGINAGGKRITNVAPGKDGTDAVNVNQLKYVAGNISNQINNVDKGLRAGIAGALASGGLYHVTTAGKSMVSVGAGTYRGQNALAVGYSRLSDNGKVGVKFTVNSNSQGHAGASASVGYQW